MSRKGIRAAEFIQVRVGGDTKRALRKMAKARNASLSELLSKPISSLLRRA